MVSFAATANEHMPTKSKHLKARGIEELQTFETWQRNSSEAKKAAGVLRSYSNTLSDGPSLIERYISLGLTEIESWRSETQYGQIEAARTPY
jgi:hypothetical protein